MLKTILFTKESPKYQAWDMMHRKNKKKSDLYEKWSDEWK